jgi:hypothetical protein
MLSVLPVTGFARDDVPHATSRILDIAFAPRNQVNVSMFHSLPGSESIIHADVDTVRGKLLQQSFPHPTDQDP